MSTIKKVAVITGAGTGIGAATAKRLAQDGFHIVINYSSSAVAAAEVVKHINTKYGEGRAIAIQANLAKMDDVKRLAKESLAFGTVTALVLNSGAMAGAPLGELTEAMYSDSFEVNYKGHLFLIQALEPRMPPESSIVAVSTLAARTTAVPPGPVHLYMASKGALEQSMKALAKELGPKKIRVNTVSPGPTGSENFYAYASAPGALEYLTGLSPMGRIGKVEEVAAVISFLAGPDSVWVSGQVIGVDGAATVG